MKHEKPVGKVKPERELDMEIKQNPHDTVLGDKNSGLGRFCYLGRFCVSKVSTSSQFA